MRSSATNQIQVRRSRRNRNRVTANQSREHVIRFVPKTKYRNSYRTADGVLVVSKRKRAPPTPAEMEAKKARLLQIKIKQVSLVNLRHKIIALWQFGMHTEDLQFGPKSSKKIIEFVQQNYPQYAHFNAAKSFFWRTIKKHQEGLATPHLEAHRDRRGENRRSSKRRSPENVALVDELLSEPKATAPKVKRALFNRGINLSVATIRRIAKDLKFR